MVWFAKISYLINLEGLLWNKNNNFSCRIQFQVVRTLEEFLATKSTVVDNQLLLDLKHALRRFAEPFTRRMVQLFGSM